MELDEIFAKSPEELAAKNGETIEPKTEETPEAAEQPEKVIEKSSTEAQATWLDEVNKSLGTQFKVKEEILTHIEKAKKTDEYEEKIKTFGDFEKREQDYKQRLEDAKSSLNPMKYFSSPDAYKAEQLRMQFPDKNPMLLQEVATSDLTKMDNVEIIIKGVMLDNKDVSYEDARNYVLTEYGIAEVDPSEWSAAAKTKIKIKAGEQRKALTDLKAQIKLPEVETDEQKAATVAELRKQKETAIEPYADTFAKFEKFVSKIDDERTFEFTAPDEYKAALKDMFKGYFLDGGNEVNPENLKTIQKLRDAMLLYDNFPKVYKAIEGEVGLKFKAEEDKRLGNEKPENKTLATDQGAQKPGGMETFLNQ